jgi:peroxiredoxin
LYEKHQDQGFEVVAVETKGQTERATKFIEENGLTYTMLQNGEGDAEVAKQIFNVLYHPSSFLIDRDGKVMYYHHHPSSFLIDRDGKVMYYHLRFEAGDEEHLEEEIKTLLS